jgi:hypothetical protein
MSRARVAAALACVVLLAGCTPAPALPSGLTTAEVLEIRAAENVQWWFAMFPNEPMPEIEPIAEVALADADAVRSECALAALPPGAVTEEGDANFLDGTGATVLDRAYFQCVLLYPLELEDPTEAGYLSQAQLSWLYDYYETRLVPCLQLAGFVVGAQPEREWFVDSVYGSWSPYYAMSPTPSTSSGWAQLDLRCPPPPFGAEYRPRDGS